MKILIISNLYPPHVLGGYEILCHQVVSYLEARGHEAFVLTSDHGAGGQGGSSSDPQSPGMGSTSSTPVQRSLHLFQGFDKPATMMRFARLRTAKHNYLVAKRFLDSHAVDVVFVWSLLRTTASPAKAAEDSGLPVVYTFNDENIAGYLHPRFSWHPKAAVRWLLDSLIMPSITLKGIIFRTSTCISSVTKRNLLAKGMPIASSQVIFQGIPIERFPLKEHPGEMHDPVRILYAGQLHAYKGVHTLVAALGLLEQKRLPFSFSLTIAGTGPDEYVKRLHTEAEQASIEVDFPGRIDHAHMPHVYRQHDLFVFPSIWEEPFGLTHLEAMASGLPVVSTVNGGQGEFLKDDVNALAFPPDDPHALAACLQRLMGDPQLAMRLARAGREVVERQFTFDRYVDDLERLLEDARENVSKSAHGNA